MNIRFGMAGTGAMARAMTPAFRFAAGVDLVAVSSTSEERAKEFAGAHGVATAYGAFGAMLADPNLDAVYIANRTRDHAHASIAALEAGKHVLCEKPFAMNADEGAKVVDAARASGKLFMEGLWTHFLPAYQRVFELVREKQIGEPLQLVAGYGYPTSTDIRPRLFDEEDGGVLLDIAVYPVSLALRLLGPVETLSTDLVRNAAGVDTHVAMQMRHGSGAISQLTASFDVLTSNAAAIACRDGQAAMPAPLFGAEQVVVDRFQQASGAGASGGKSRLKALLKQNPILRRLKTALGAAEHHPYGADQYLPQMQHFASLIEQEKTQSDIVSHDLSLSTLRIIDRLRAEGNE